MSDKAHERVQFMPINNKTTKAQLTKYAKKLEAALDAYRKGYYASGSKWFGVGPEEADWDDVYFVYATTPIAAIEEYEADIGGDNSALIVYCVNPELKFRVVEQERVWEMVQ